MHPSRHARSPITQITTPRQQPRPATTRTLAHFPATATIPPDEHGCSSNMDGTSTPYEGEAPGLRAGITSHVSVIGAQHHQGRRAGVRVARGVRRVSPHPRGSVGRTPRKPVARGPADRSSLGTCSGSPTAWRSPSRAHCWLPWPAASPPGPPSMPSRAAPEADPSPARPGDPTGEGRRPRGSPRQQLFRRISHRRRPQHREHGT